MSRKQAFNHLLEATVAQMWGRYKINAVEFDKIFTNKANLGVQIKGDDPERRVCRCCRLVP